MQIDTELKKQQFIKKMKLFCVFMFTAIIFLLIWAFFRSGSYQRNTESLLNQYYMLQKTNPKAAQQALTLILQQDPNNVIASMELAKLRHPNQFPPLTWGEFPIVGQMMWISQYVLSIPVNDNENLQSYLSDTVYLKFHLSEESIREQMQAWLTGEESGGACNRPVDIISLAKAGLPLLPWVKEASMPNFNLQEPPELNLVNRTTVAFNQVDVAYTLENENMFATPTAERDQLLNAFYQEKAKDPQKALNIILHLLELYPNDLVALKETGYLYLAYNNQAAALPFFFRAYALTHDPNLAMQIAYCYNILGDNRSAYRYFSLATLNSSTDPQLNLKAQIAMTNLAGFQMKILPNPYYAEFYYAPFYFSRFRLVVNPFVARAGVILNQDYNVKLYTSFSWSRDDRSSATTQISQIYNDDIALTAVGLSAQPIKKIPLIAFSQVGRAYDLLGVQPIWRNDFRGGLIYFNRWGASPTYTENAAFPIKWVGSMYADAIYYSRYQNTISDSRLRQGLRIFQAQSTEVDFYLTGHMILDTKHEFYNNIIEYGPGIAIIPSTRYNNTIRLESLRGYYLPVNSPSPNPYGPNYTNQVIQLETYLQF